MTRTAGYHKLPPDAAIPFAGFEYAQIPSRRLVLSKVQDFINYCLSVARSPAVRVILGEWGEGKSEAFARYIKPTLDARGQTAVSIDAKTIANSYRYVESQSPQPAAQFLAAVFYALRSQDKSTLPAVERFADLQPWFSEFLTVLTDGGRRKLFVFVDEFEDLILEPEALRKILAGIKATINGQYQPIAEGGEFEGSLFFFLSCTPDAYSKMRNDPDVAQVFGSYDRRVDLIDLHPISKSEGLHFLWDLLLYAYDKELPQPLPISSAGVLHTIFTVARGNTGALVSLLTRLLARSRTPDNRLNVLDYESILGIFPNEHISMLGSSWACLEKPFYDSLIRHLEEAKLTRDFHRLFKLLVGELTPFSSSEIAHRINIDEGMVLPIIRETNKALRRTGLSDAIVPLAIVDDRWDFQMILKEFIDSDRLTIGEFKGTLEEFLQRFEFPVLTPNGLELRRFFPIGEDSIRTYLEGVSLELAKAISSKLPKIENGGRYYSVSPAIVAELYPTPAPPDLDYVKDPETRAEAWQTVSRDFEATFKALGAAPFTEFVRKCKDLPIRITETFPSLERADFFTARDTFRDVTLSVCTLSWHGNVTGDTLKSVQHLLSRQRTPVHVILLFYTGDNNIPWTEAEQHRMLLDRIVFVYAHPTLAKRVMAGYILSKDYPARISSQFFEQAVRKLLITELRFTEKWEEWLSHATQKGLAVGDPVRASARTEKDLADAMKFYLNCAENTAKPVEVFERNMHLQALTVFDTKTGLIPDIESSDQLLKITTDLQSNKFLGSTPNGLTVLRTPIETRILSLLSTDTPMSLQAIKDHFLILSQNKSILEQVYLPLLEFKGLIVRKTGYTRVRRDVVLNELGERVKRYERQIELYKKRSSFEDAHVFVTKKRDDRLITLEAFNACIQREFDEITPHRSDDFVLSKARLVNMLLDVFQDDLDPKIQLAQKQREELRSEIGQFQNRIHSDLAILKNEFSRWTDFTFEDTQVREFRRLTATIADAQTILDAHLKLESERWREKIPFDEFSYRDFERGDRSFDMQIYVARNRLREVRTSETHFHSEAIAIETLTSDLKRDLNQLHSNLNTIVVPSDLTLAAELKTFLGKTSQHAHIDDRPETAEHWAFEISIQEIAAEIKKERSKTDELVRFLSRLSLLLPQVANAEEKLIRSLADAHQEIQRGTKTMDAESFSTSAKRLEHKIAKFDEQYLDLRQQMAKTVQSQSRRVMDYAEVLNELERLALQIPVATAELQDIWGEFKEHLKGEITAFSRALAALPRTTEKERIESQVADLRSRLETSTYSKTSRKMSEFEQVLSDAREGFRRYLRNLLSTQEVLVFDSLTSVLPVTGTWVASEDLAVQIAKKTNLPKEQCLQELRSLANKGLLIQGFRLAT